MTALVVLGCIFGYVVIGSSIGFRLRYKGVACDCSARNPGDRHRAYCVSGPVSLICAAFWPMAFPVWVGYALANKKRIFGFRMRRAERAARRIADLEREIYGGIR